MTDCVKEYTPNIIVKNEDINLNSTDENKKEISEKNNANNSLRNLSMDLNPSFQDIDNFQRKSIGQNNNDCFLN